MKVNEIVKKLREASDSYYNQHESTITDYEFDTLKDNLESLDPSNPFLSQIGAPVKISSWKKAKHSIGMTSLNKVNISEEFFKWCDSNDVTDLIMEDKLDGISIDLEYSDGTLLKAITRGDGIEGEDIYENVKKMQNVKLKIEGFSGCIRGEIFLFQEDFERVNEIAKKNGDRQLSNPRNGAGGIAKRHDGKYSEYNSILYYDITDNNKDFETEEEKMEMITYFGLPVCFYKKVTRFRAEEIYKNYEKSLRVTTPYDIDGLVIKVNNIQKQIDLGEKGGKPAGQIAWKFTSMKAETIIEGMEWSIRNKHVTPIALLKSVSLGGVNVARASCHNISIFKELDMGVGDKVLISRRNDVIPQIEEVLESKGKKFQDPTNCPSCHEWLKIEGKFLTCVNDVCGAGAVGNLVKWLEALDVKDVGRKTIENLFDAELIKYPSDYYTLKKEDITSLERMGEKSADKILSELESHREVELPSFIKGLNISMFSRSRAETLVEAGLDTLEKMQKANLKELVLIDGIEEKTALKIIEGMEEKKIEIERLLKYITFKEAEEVEMESSNLIDTSFCFTGAIQKLDSNGKRFTRGMMEKLVLENGGSISKVKRGLTYLVMADPNSTSSKVAKAFKLGVKLLSEESFFKMLNN